MLMRRMIRFRRKVGFEDLTYKARMKQTAREGENLRLRRRGGPTFLLVPGFVPLLLSLLFLLSLLSSLS
jgi:hypothetical protein